MKKIDEMAKEITDMCEAHAMDMSLPAAYRRFIRAFHAAAVGNPIGLKYFLVYGARGAAEDPEGFADIANDLAREDDESGNE